MIGVLWNSWQMRMHWIWLKAIFGWTLSRPLHVGLHVLIGLSVRPPPIRLSVLWCMPTSVHPFVVYRFSLYVCNVFLSLLLNFEQAVYMFYLHFFSSSSARTQKVRSVGKFVSFFLLAILPDSGKTMLVVSVFKNNQIWSLHTSSKVLLWMTVKYMGASYSQPSSETLAPFAVMVNNLFCLVCNFLLLKIMIFT